MDQIIMSPSISVKRQMLDEEFVTNYGKLLSFARGMAKKWMFDELAEDDECAARMLLHNAYVRAEAALPHFYPERQAIGFWLVKIMHNILLEMRRSFCTQRRQHAENFSLSEVEDQGVAVKPLHQDSFMSKNPDEYVIPQDQLQQALCHLNPRDRTIVDLYHFQGVAGSEIAQMLNWSTRQFHSHLHYIYAYLRPFLTNS